MPYTAPEIDTLLKNIPTRTHFPHETPPRLLLADQLTHIIEIISEQNKSNGDDNKNLLSSLMGANIYCLELISQEYYFHSPELKKGFIYNSGSPFYSFIAQGLGIKAPNTLTARDKFIYLIKFNQWLSTHQQELENMKPYPISVKELQTKIKLMLTGLLSTLTTDIANIVNAIPTEKSVTKHMEKLPEGYLKKKIAQSNSWYAYFIPINKSRIMLTQLAQLISNIQCEDESNLPINVMTRSQRIKMGLLKYIDKSIEKEYWVRSATNSTLYSTAKEILNSHSIENLTSTQTLACLSAFHSLISSHEERAKLEVAARHYFKEDNLLENIDAVLIPLSHQLTQMEKELESLTSTNWPATKALSNMGRIIGAAPGYGLGSVVGFAASETQPCHLSKTTVGATATNVAKAFFQTNSIGYFSFVMGDFLIGSTLTRAFAKLFEYIGMTMVGAAGGVIGFTFDLSYKGFREAGKRFINYCEENPIQMRNADCTFIQCLLDLPTDLFSEEKQNQIMYAQGVDGEKEIKNAATTPA